MATNTRDIRCHVELYDTTTITHTQLKQGDTTHLILELYRDGQPHDLDGITLTLTALRPDGKAVIQTDGYTAAANVAEVVLAPAIVALSGRVQFEVTLVEVKSGDVLSSFAFARTLEPRLVSDETVSPDEADRVTEIVINSTRAPYIGPDGAWWQWDNDKHAFVSTGVVPGEGGSAVPVDRISADKVIYPDDLTTTYAMGNFALENGQATIPAKGKSVTEVWNSIWLKEANPTITDPAVTLTFGAAKAYEVGTEVTPSYSASLSAGSYQYGPDTGIKASAWEVTNTNGNKLTTASGTFPKITVTDGMSYKITAKATHNAGTVPVTNLGNDYTAGQIAAGLKSATSGAVTGYRSYFYGVLDTPSATTPLTSAIIRGMKNGGAYNGSKTFTLNGSATAKRIVIAIPSASTRAGLKEVILTSAMNTPVTDSYKLTEKALKVAGVGSASSVDYDVYVYEPASIDAGEVHKITLA